MTDTQNAFDLDIFRQSKQLPDIAFSGYSVVMLAVANLCPATAKRQ